MHSPGRFRAASRSAPRHLPRWDAPDPNDDDDSFLSASDLVKTLQPVPRRSSQSRRPMTDRRWAPPPMETPMGFNDWSFDGPPPAEDARAGAADRSRAPKNGVMRGPRSFPGDQLDLDPDMLQDGEDYEVARTRAMYDVEPRHSQAQLQRYQQQQKQYQRAMQREFGGDSTQLYRRATSHPEHEIYVREARGREPLDDLPFDPPRRIPRSTPPPAVATSSPLVSFGLRPNGLMRDTRAMQNRRYHAPAPSTHSPNYGPRVDEFPLEPAMLEMYQDEMDSPPTAAGSMSRRRGYAPPQQQHRIHQQMPRRRQSIEHLDDDLLNNRRPFHDAGLPRDRRGVESRGVYEELVPTPTTAGVAQNHGFGNLTPSREDDDLVAIAAINGASASRPGQSRPIDRVQKLKRSRPDDPPTPASSVSVTDEPKATAKAAKAKRKQTAASNASSMNTEGKDRESQPKRRCGRKSMNYSSEQKRERNRAAVKKCRQRQALKLEYLQHKAESLAAENQALSEMLVKNTELDEEQRTSLTRGIQMDILLKIKEIFTQSLPKDFVLDADSIWDLNSVLAVSMPSRCYYGIESIKDFWRTSLRMRNKGKIRSFWAWLFRLPPGDRFSEFDIQPFSPTSNLYFISWTTKSTPPLAGSMVIMFGNGHRVTLHVECFGWLIWRYLLTNEPFPEPPLE
ncbi:hypothetical protein PRNP1_000398 [Phytophthora ramorum]